MTENIQETIREIKKDFRLSMNGVVSTLQRRQGLQYKINFGIEIPRLKSIAGKYPQDKMLAKALWKEDIRECKILATYLLPEEEYSSVAEEWIAETRYTEIADRLAMQVLSKLPDACGKAFRWASQNEDMTAYCGFMTLSHLLRNGYSLNEEEELQLFGIVAGIAETEKGAMLKRCALNALLHYIETDTDREERLRRTLVENGSTGLLGML